MFEQEDFKDGANFSLPISMGAQLLYRDNLERRADGAPAAGAMKKSFEEAFKKFEILPVIMQEKFIPLESLSEGLPLSLATEEWIQLKVPNAFNTAYKRFTENMPDGKINKIKFLQAIASYKVADTYNDKNPQEIASIIKRQPTFKKPLADELDLYQVIGLKENPFKFLDTVNEKINGKTKQWVDKGNANLVHLLGLECTKFLPKEEAEKRCIQSVSSAFQKGLTEYPKFDAKCMVADKLKILRQLNVPSGTDQEQYVAELSKKQMLCEKKQEIDSKVNDLIENKGFVPDAFLKKAISSSTINAMKSIKNFIKNLSQEYLQSDIVTHEPMDPSTELAAEELATKLAGQRVLGGIRSGWSVFSHSNKGTMENAFSRLVTFPLCECEEVNLIWNPGTDNNSNPYKLQTTYSYNGVKKNSDWNLKNNEFTAYANMGELRWDDSNPNNNDKVIYKCRAPDMFTVVLSDKGEGEALHFADPNSILGEFMHQRQHDEMPMDVNMIREGDGPSAGHLPRGR